MKSGNSRDKWVLVTGAGTGIGRFTAEYLAANGFSVYACARREGGLGELGRIRYIEPIRLDVTDRSQIGAAVELITKNGTGLYGLVNNAGIVKGGPLAVLPEGYLEEAFAVNLFGVHEVTKAFFPMIQRANGRIVIVGSVMGFIAYPFTGPYSASKRALEAYTDCLRRELLLTGVKVSLIQPGYVKTALGQKSARELDNTLQYLNNSLWETYREPSLAAVREVLGGWEKRTVPISRVAKAVLKGLTRRSPRRRYLVTEKNTKYRLIRLLPDFVLDRYFKHLYRTRQAER